MGKNACLIAIFALLLLSFPNRSFGTVTLQPLWSTPGASISPFLLGHNTVWSRGGLGVWDDSGGQLDPSVLPLVKAVRPGMLRFPGGTRAMRYHFAETIGPMSSRRPQCDPFTGKLDKTGYGLDEFLKLAEEVGARAALVSSWVDGSPQEAAAMIAYVNARPDSKVVIGRDPAGKNWGTAADWARRRARNGHPEPYRVPVLEIGNEQYLNARFGPPTSCGRKGRFRQNERWVNGIAIPTTAKDHAEQVRLTGRLVKKVDPSIRIGASALSSYDLTRDAADAVATLDVPTRLRWNHELVSRAGAGFDLFVLHPYAMSPDSNLKLAAGLRKTAIDLRRLDPTKKAAVTEFGYYTGSGTLQDVFLTGQITAVAIEEGMETCLRHILIEDKDSGLFARSAAILGPKHELMPGYLAVKMLTETLQGRHVPLSGAKGALTVLAAERSDKSLALVLIRPDADKTTREIEVPLPPGRWTAKLIALSGTSADAELKDIREEHSTLKAESSLRLSLKDYSLTVAILRP